jgi:hypothetical protein
MRSLIILLRWLLRADRGDAHHVSDRWLIEQEQREMGAGIDGVNWVWPVRE